jgi:predicted GIY-YIG superfamily endonuclease|tara:strand:- start:2626 stop:3036 length:411 start_codon:yes stop_codon:yes gene_type:complete
MEKKWCCYIIENNGYTYCGASNDAMRRLRCHNGEIKGGSKYTTSKGNGWKIVCIIHGFPNKTTALQFAWSIKHIQPIHAGGVRSCIKKVMIVLNKEKWTCKSPYSSTIILTLEWLIPEYRPNDISLPLTIIEKIKN